MSDVLLERLIPFIGEWRTEAAIGGRPMANGHTRFEWLGNKQFVIQRADAEMAPDLPREWVENSPFPITSIIGLDDATGLFTMLYTDTRHVHRVVNMMVSAGVWKLWRDSPGFFQRYVGTFDTDGTTINGSWQRSQDGTHWAHDFDLVYHKVG
ncbi:MAG: hypothetical protein AAAB35_09470 [Phyllobacterium sp.]|uniref:hypothetical protein n=1 Tax=Phyllobacterium sp. TaxID=1871046 RepID=UPI0030F35DDD